MGFWFPEQGSNPHSLLWKCGVLTTGPPGKSILVSLGTAKESDDMSLTELANLAKSKTFKFTYKITRAQCNYTISVKPYQVLFQTWLKSIRMQRDFDGGRVSLFLC